MSIFRRLYERLVFENTPWLIFLIGVFAFWTLTGLPNFRLDASSESLVLEKDKDLAFYRQVTDLYGSSDFLVLTVTPKAPLFSDESLILVRGLRDQIRELEGVETVLTVLDVPLLSNPPVPMDNLVSNIKSLEHPDADIQLAKEELSNSPLYVNLLLNLEENTTAIQINLPKDEVYAALIKTRQALFEKSDEDLTEKNREELKQLSRSITEQVALNSAHTHALIEQVRDIIDAYRDRAEIHLGGIPMIADDVMTFVKSDLLNFGLAVLAFLVAALFIIFRRLRWVTIPLICCGSVSVMMLGVLGKLDWPVTVISSNFISLLIILTLSMSIHLIVRYRELLRRNPHWNQEKLVSETIQYIWIPCLYMALTTAVAFSSLVFSGIRPVINFGLMMTVGIILAYIVTFLLFPAILMLLGKDHESGERSEGGSVMSMFAQLTIRWGNVIILSAMALTAFTIIGVSKLVVENSFIEYFDEQTEIYQGMTVIDQRLGGTTPLEILIDFPETEILVVEESSEEVDLSELGITDDDFFDEDIFDDDEDMFGGDAFASADEDLNKYWFTTDKIALVKEVHNYLDALPETGKVLSLATMMEIAEEFNDGKALDNLQLALLYTVIPLEFRDIVVNPYVSIENNQVRISVRIMDSNKDLKRDELLHRIQSELSSKLGIEPSRIHISGMMVLYNNMLQSLFSSQISTLGAVFAGIMMMFLVLFRGFKISVIAMVPNMLAALLVLGVMGWMGIPLDMMTISIASITIGIAVDNTIHYIVRFKRELAKDNDYDKALHRSHGSIGKAMWYTSLIIVIGFSILMLSNFKPTIYFGVLTAIAMFIALLGALTLLPRLIVIFKAYD